MKADAALLPTTLMMVVLSAKSGELAERIGSRLQLTVGPLTAAAGLLLLPRIGPGASWVRDVLPGSLVFGLGLATFVAPLTATVMGSVNPGHVSIASGVNNAVARTASLAALSVIPVASGLTTASGAAALDARRAAHTARSTARRCKPIRTRRRERGSNTHPRDVCMRAHRQHEIYRV